MADLLVAVMVAHLAEKLDLCLVALWVELRVVCWASLLAVSMGVTTVAQ